MWIEPNSRIILLNDVPIDKDQTDTLWFADRAAQISYFMSKIKREFPKCTYQRSNRNYARVDCRTVDIYDCNYLMFQNTAYGEKWFFAFVDAIDYVNDNVTEVQYTIDPVQTWFFDYVTDECFIERIHSLTDNIGDNIAPESVDLGEIVSNGFNDFEGAGNETRIVVLWIDPEAPNSGYINEGIYEGCNMIAYSTDEADTLLRTFINMQAANNLDSIVGMYMCPAWLVNYASGGQYVQRPVGDYIGAKYDALTGNETLDGYTPKNKKLYTYPYNRFSVISGDGQSLDLRYEFFGDKRPSIVMTGNASPPASLTIMPFNYKGSGDDAGEPYELERVTMTGYPQCSWSADAFRAWWAQNSVPIMNNAIAAAANTAIGAASVFSTDPTAGLREGATRTVDMIADVLNQGYAASIRADISKGSFQNGSGDFSSGRMNTFKYSRMSVNRQYAERIDHFFTMFGYSLGKYGTPSRHHRSRFTYVKTIGAQISGSLPADDAQYIATCYNNGIRFWADHDKVGVYYLDNLPLGS